MSETGPGHLMLQRQLKGNIVFEIFLRYTVKTSYIILLCCVAFLKKRGLLI